MPISFIEDGEQIKCHFEQLLHCIEWNKEGKDGGDPNKPQHEIIAGYIKNQQDMEKGMQEYFDYCNEVVSRNQRVLKAIKSVRGKGFHKRLVEYLSHCEADRHFPYEIVREPIGAVQDAEFGRLISKEWVNQTTNGGYTGDSYAGTICIEIKKDRYLKFHYSM
jgi:hypothetical protein